MIHKLFTDYLEPFFKFFFLFSKRQLYIYIRMHGNKQFRENTEENSTCYSTKQQYLHAQTFKGV